MMSKIVVEKDCIKDSHDCGLPCSTVLCCPEVATFSRSTVVLGVTDFEMPSALQTEHLFPGDVGGAGKMGSTSTDGHYGLYGGDNLCAILCFLSAFCGMRGFLGCRATRDAMARVSFEIILLDPRTVVCAAVFCAGCAGEVCLF